VRAVHHTTLPLTLTLVLFKRLFSWMLQVLSGHTQGDVRHEFTSVKTTRPVDSQGLESLL